jgi:hypothetical protein
MRSTLAVLLFAAAVAAVVVSEPGLTAAQDKKKDDTKKFDPPKPTKPDEATLAVIATKTEELRKAVAALKEKKVRDDVLIEVEIYLKAAENIVRFEEWYAANSGKWALTTLDQGLARAKQAGEGKPVWRDAPGKWVVRAYRSSVDLSIQPFAMLLPADYGKDPKKKWRFDVVLHGRDASLTEAKFIASHQGAAPKDLDHVIVEVYGRGNNAYRWAGEMDVIEAFTWGAMSSASPPEFVVDPSRVVLRGFSMGGAGTWHIGLHHPGYFCVIGPGAGFTTTHGYVGGLPKELPDYQEKCLRIYDAVGYAENVFNVPVVAYSGEKDAQKKAADNIENALKNFKEPHKFTHLVAPGLEHQMPKEWQDKAEAEYRKYVEKGRDPNGRVRFVTYTPQFGDFGWFAVEALDRQYEKAVVDGTSGNGSTLKTTNVRRLSLMTDDDKTAYDVTIDGQSFKGLKARSWNSLLVRAIILEKRDGKWAVLEDEPATPIKSRRVCGPIDHAFCNWFAVVEPDGKSWHGETDRYAAAELKRFGGEWDRYFRGKLPVLNRAEYEPVQVRNLVLFGDPQSNSFIAKVLPKLPITWTKEKLVVNGVEYDPKTHVPVLIYPNPLNENRGYVVINSGHTFKEADLKGTNALLYPRLGDWAVIKPTPTAKDPAAYEVVAAGLFDENWQFPKKK